MTGQNPLLLFLIEVVKRLKKKSPKFFVILQNIALVAGAITGLPLLLDELNVELPSWATIFQSKLVMWCSAIVFLWSKFPVDNNNEPVASNDLPFTNKK